jgi:hypothetical protein
MEKTNPHSQQPDPAQHLMQFAAGYVPSAVLWVIAELNIADLLKNGPRPVSELAQATRTNEDALYRSLRLLAMVGIFAETQPRHFTLSPSAELLCTDAKGSLRDSVIWIADPMHLRVASEWLHSVKTGEPTIEHMMGKPAFDYFAEEPIEFGRFHRAMTAMSAMAIYPVLEAYDFSPFSNIVDVAGGHGFVLCEILRKYPKANGVLFDVAEVKKGGDERIEQCKLGSAAAPPAEISSSPFPRAAIFTS